MLRETILADTHRNVGAKMVDFAGWLMPLHYGSQIEEHHHVRQSAGCFDVSHMGVLEVTGEFARDFLRFVLANDVAKLTNPGKALYTCMLNSLGGVVDDLIVYFIAPQHYRIVLNAGRRDADMCWLSDQAKDFSVNLNLRNDVAIIAVQGPEARTLVNRLFSDAEQAQLQLLSNFQGTFIRDVWIARTGYTGEEGYEIILPCKEAASFWEQLIIAGVRPCGLGARDTLRLEAGLHLYGNDMDESTSPLESNLAWTIAFLPEDRNFVGKQALLTQKEKGLEQQLIGLVLEEKGVLRSHQKVWIGQLEGEITSGTFSPTMGQAIAFARVPVNQETQCLVEIRDKKLPAKIVKPPFVRNGKILV